MKTKLSIVLQLSFLLILSSCSKEKTEANGRSLTGKWRFVEIYNGYANGGSFMWDSVAANNSHLLEFTANGQYSKKYAVASNQQCSGTYQVLSDSLVEIASNCQGGVEKATISELTSQNLILDYRVREGVIKYKYVAEK